MSIPASEIAQALVNIRKELREKLLEAEADEQKYKSNESEIKRLGQENRALVQKYNVLSEFFQSSVLQKAKDSAAKLAHEAISLNGDSLQEVAVDAINREDTTF